MLSDTRDERQAAFEVLKVITKLAALTGDPRTMSSREAGTNAPYMHALMFYPQHHREQQALGANNEQTRRQGLTCWR